MAADVNPARARTRPPRSAVLVAVGLVALAGVLASCSSGGSGSDAAGGSASSTTTAKGGTTTLPYGAEPDPKAPFPCNLVSKGELASLGIIGSDDGVVGDAGGLYGDGTRCTWTADPATVDGQPPSLHLTVFTDPDINAWIAQSQSGNPDVARQHISGVGDLAYGRTDGEISFVTGKKLVELQILPPVTGKQAVMITVGTKIEARLAKQG